MFLDDLVEEPAKYISDQAKYEDCKQSESGDEDFMCPSEDSSCVGNSQLSPLALLFRTYKDGNMLALVKSVLEQNHLNKSDSIGLNTKADETDALIALCAYQHDHPDFMAIARLLIENGTNINAVDDQCRNSLIILCMEHLDTDDLLVMAQLLIQNGIDVKARDKNGSSAVTVLCQRGFSKCSPTMRLLLRS
jgi:ankyrin repeat protein